MMTSTLALLILFGSALLVLSYLRVVVQDTCSMLARCAGRARDSGQMISRGAFVTLWLLIFFLSFY
ncbi:MAG: hypothetical protein ACU0CC_00725 [Sagittula sp.]|jgi:hypothetical protein|uniref:hypothetical protein n=1 Tax=unclassified Sagittula TaxID=2624628 RepID=UPI000C2CE9AF|nr:MULTISPECIES: hypothetical protein [unclassified Sagittula]AUC53067.1 hypothetical protein CDO87_07585 [Sagittula sp. P11]WHZ35589.1 hypothetical protein QNI11_00960 [Sagittula sp. MA-2]